ncbi:putative nuclease HARBI1 [Tanacetum coccineum]|uniref:Nuclease HARBI1 n=1 Tax=Tanacetum coccineum TaxID=301880 RepID=A0ABQ5J2N4_9ASTR
MNQNKIGRTVFDIDEETDAFYLQKATEYHEWLLQQETQPRLNRTPIFRDREDAERRLWADYFDDHWSYLCILDSSRDINPCLVDALRPCIEANCCASFYVRRLGKALNCENFKWNVGYDMVLQTGQLDFYAKVGDMSSAKRVYNEMPRKEIDLSIGKMNSVLTWIYHGSLAYSSR